MNIRRALLSAGLATSVALGGLAAQPIASAQTTANTNTATTNTSSVSDLSSKSERTNTQAETSSMKDTDPDTVLEWMGVVTAGLSIVATLYTLITSMGNNAQFRF